MPSFNFSAEIVFISPFSTIQHGCSGVTVISFPFVKLSL